MSGIRGRNTGPELRVRRLLHRKGFRFRLHRRDLPGAPDIVLPKYRVAIFVHGCFWHLHSGCRLAKLPASSTDFWLSKLLGNRARDAAAIDSLLKEGWRALVVWECWLRKTREDDKAAEVLAAWIRDDQSFGELSGELIAGFEV